MQAEASPHLLPHRASPVSHPLPYCIGAQRSSPVCSALRRARLSPRPMNGGRIARQIERIDHGRMALARNPELIAKSISMLTGSLREKMLAEERLVAAGEFAVPGLLAVVVGQFFTVLYHWAHRNGLFGQRMAIQKAGAPA